MREFSEKNEFEFTMVADRAVKIAKSYNVDTFASLLDKEDMKSKMATPSDFLINKEGIIIWKIINTKTFRPSMEVLLKAIDKNIKNPY